MANCPTARTLWRPLTQHVAPGRRRSDRCCGEGQERELGRGLICLESAFLSSAPILALRLAHWRIHDEDHHPCRDGDALPRCPDDDSDVPIANRRYGL